MHGALVMVCDDTAVVVAFDEFELDPARFELRRNGERVALEPQVFAVLAYLVAHADRVVTKHELLDEVWGSRFVSESALTTRIKTARQALGDDGRTQRYIRTIHGLGYRFMAPSDSGAPRSGPGWHAAGVTPERGNLPVDRTPLFGRDADVTGVGGIIAEHRLVSLLGIGGTGKTRLAIASARALADEFADGTWFVDLVPVADSRGIELALADTLRLGLGGDRPVRDQLAALLADRQALFVLDNAEHVADDLAAVLDHLLEYTGAPRFVVTSRVPLGLPDERRVPIGALALDPDHSDGDTDRATSPAVALLTSAAERFGARLSGSDPAALQRICRSLDGLPLAIELAAAQLRHLDAAALADRLDHRFDMLADRRRPGRERHASLEAVLIDTWDALDPDERELLEQLAAFPATFTLDDLVTLSAQDAAPAAADVELVLGGLVDHSLVVREAGRVSRYRLLETVKRFTRQQCDSDRSGAIDDCHATWCLAAVGDDPRRYLFDFDVSDWCADHFADLRAAVGHLRRSGRSVDAARLLGAAALAMHADIGSRAAAVLEWVSADLVTIDDDALATQLHLTAVMCGMATRSPATIAEHGEQALALARLVGDPVLLNAALVLCSWSTVFADPAAALAMTIEAGGVDDPLGRDFADGYRAFVLAMMRRYDEAEAVARAVMERAPADARRTYPTHVGVAALTSLTCVHDPEGTLPLAHEVFAVPSERNSMWANDLIAAAIRAANGHAAVAADITDAIRARLEQAGQDPWPDLLIPTTAYAVHRGEIARAAGWLDAIRAARRPTQSFQATILYRRLRDAVGDTVPDTPAGDTLEEIGTRALTWLAAHP